MISYIRNLNIYDKLILIYGIPSLVLITSRLPYLTGIQKLSFIFLILIMIFGLEHILLSLTNQKKLKKFKKRRFVMKDLNIGFLNYIKPIDLIFFSSACSTGGILFFYLLEQSISTYLTGTIMFFIFLKGMHLLIVDLFSEKHILSFQKNITSIFQKWYITLILFSIGIFAGYKIYSTEISNLVLSGILFSLFSKINFLNKLNKN
jgi:hypothetical protein